MPIQEDHSHPGGARRRHRMRFGAEVQADGSVRFLRTGNRSPEELRRILQIGGFTEEEIGNQGDFYGGRLRLNWPNIAALAVWLLSVGVLLTHAVRCRKPQAVPPTTPAG